jgi:cytochrome c biogenesis protein
VLHGYRFYSTFNKGFAVLLSWQSPGGEAVMGAVHLPSYPANENAQAREWHPPGSAQPIWVMLDFNEVLLLPDQPSRFRLPTDHKLVLRQGDQRWELRSGERISLAGGTIGYHGLETWMGYTVFYDWTIPWLLAACLMAVLSLSWHFWAKFAAKPWNPDGT